MTFRFHLIILLLITLARTNDASAQSEISPQAVQAHIEYLASPELAGRRGDNSRRAADYVAKKFEELGLTTVFPNASYLQTIPGPRTESGEPSVAGWNVVGCWEGNDPELRNEYLIISAHHDHLGQGTGGIFYGADDNASGVAMVMEVARLLKESGWKPRRSLLFVSFDLEEHLLFGSRWFVAHPPVPLEKIQLMIVADMLGRSLGDLPLESFFLFGSEHASGLTDVIQQTEFPGPWKPVLLSDDFVGTRSDYGPFRDQKIPFLFASTGQSRDYHTFQDTADKINFPQVAAISTGIARLVKEVANQNEPPEWIASPEFSEEEVRAVLRIVEKIEQQANAWKLSGIQRLFVSQARQQAERILAAEEISAEDHAWLTRTVQLLLFSVF